MADTANSKYLGSWKGVSMTALGKTEPLTVDNTIVLRADGTAVYTTPDETRAYIWKETDYGVFLDGKADLKLKADGDKLTTRVLGFVTINFEKQ